MKEKGLPRKMEFPVSNEGIRAALNALLSRADAAGIPRQVAHRMAVVVDEYCSNLIRHDATMSAESCFSLDLQPLTGKSILTIVENGRTFDPTTFAQSEKREIGGQGIGLMRGLAADLSYESDDQRNIFKAIFVEQAKRANSKN